MIWAGVLVCSPTDLHVFDGGTVTDVRYCDEILDPYAHLYAGAIGNDLILIDVNAGSQQAETVEDCLEGHGLQGLE
ncbi:DDE_3 domain-containing protein [Trichonephila clavipes]|nr:DDE_3 domain-containing protein [Trichonephila clavipes]